MKKHFVRFYSPGTFVAEITEKPIKSWNVKQAIKMSKKIIERHNSKPYDFCFVTRERGDKDLDSKVTKTSGMFYLGGKIYTLEEIKHRNDPKDNVLIFNMEANGWGKVITNNNSWSWCQPFEKKDVLLDVKLK